LGPGIIRWLDRNLGRLLCFLLTLHRRLFDLVRAAPPKTPRKILFLKLIEQGSSVLACPALQRAIDLVGREHVYFMVFAKNRPILDILDVVPQANILEVESVGFAAFIQSVIAGLRRARKEGIDTVVDMECFSRASAVLAYLSGAGMRVGLHRFLGDGPYRGDLFTHRLTYNPHLHVSVFFLSLVEALRHVPSDGKTPMIFEIPEVNTTPPAFSPKDDEIAALKRKIVDLTGASLKAPIFLLNPNASDLLPIRKWPAESFIALGGMLRDGFPDSSIVVTGSAPEKEGDDRIAAGIPDAVSLAGRLSLRELVTLFWVADVLITNDSGPPQFAALTPIQTIVLFGPETPLLYGRRDERCEIIAPSLVCSPCVNVYNHRHAFCRDKTCLTGVGPQDVYQRVRDLDLT